MFLGNGTCMIRENVRVKKFDGSMDTGGLCREHFACTKMRGCFFRAVDSRERCQLLALSSFLTNEHEKRCEIGRKIFWNSMDTGGCSGNILHTQKCGGVSSELSIAGKAASCYLLISSFLANEREN